MVYIVAQKVYAHFYNTTQEMANNGHNQTTLKRHPHDKKLRSTGKNHQLSAGRITLSVWRAGVGG